jgi:hypothetical protein
VWVSGEFVLEFEIIEIVLARCWGQRDAKGKLVGLRHWFRVLPSDILPYKRYSTYAHEAVVALYTTRWLPLRTVADIFAGAAPGYVTVWRFAGGIGCWALGRARVDRASEFSAVKAETGRLLGCEEELTAKWNEPVYVNPDRYRKERRKDELGAMAKILRLASHIAEVLGSIDKFVFCLWVTFMFSTDTPLRLEKNTALRISFWATSPFTPMKQASGAEHSLGSMVKEVPWTDTRAPPGSTNR